MAAPKGFKKVETGMAGFWKPTKAGQHIRGIVGEAIETAGIPVKDAEGKMVPGKPNTFHTLRVLDEKSGPVQDSKEKALKVYEGMRVGIGGRVLQNFLTEYQGKEVYLEYKGLGVAKKGQSAPKLFDVYAADDGAEAAE